MGDKRVLKAIVCDAGGVLLHPNLAWLSEQLAAEGVERSVDELHLDYYRMIAAADAEPSLDPRGVALTTDAVREWMLRRLLGDAVDALRLDALAPPLARKAGERFPGEGDLWFWAMPGLVGRLETLRSAGFRLAVASNNDGSLEGQLAAIGATELFEVRLDSAVEGVSKPDPELLLRAVRALGLEPGECLYVGDIDRVDGAAARAAGMPFALLDPLRQPRPSSPLLLSSLDAIREHFVAAA